MRLQRYAFLSLIFAMCVSSVTAEPQIPGSEEDFVQKIYIETLFTTEKQRKNGQDWAVIKANGITFFGIPADAGKLTRYQRAREIVKNRLNVLTGKGILDDQSNYNVRYVNGEFAVVIHIPRPIASLTNPVVLVTIDKNFATSMGGKATREDIAYYWRDLIAKNVVKARVKDIRNQPKDPAGRVLDPENSWFNVPPGYSKNRN